MSSVAEILSRKSSPVIAVSPDTSVFDALKIMAEKNIGSVVVMENDTYLGIVTERDYSRKVILKNKHSINTLVSEIMTVDLPHISPESSIEECMEMMTDKKIRYLPVISNNDLTGLISMSDIVNEIILLQKATIDNLNSYIYSA